MDWKSDLIHEVSNAYKHLADNDLSGQYDLMKKTSTLLERMSNEALELDKEVNAYSFKVKTEKAKLSKKYNEKSVSSGDRDALASPEYNKMIDDYMEAIKKLREQEALQDFVKRIYYESKELYFINVKQRQKYNPN